MSDVIDLDKAVKDLKWISDRINGVLSLREHISDWQALSDQKRTLSEACDQLRIDVKDFQDRLKQLQDELEDQQKLKDAVVEEANNQSKKIIADATANAGDILTKANTESKKILSDTQDQQNVLELQISTRKQDLDLVDAQVKQTSQKLIDLQNELQSLKSKF